ncbi:MAG: Rdx family protein [Proteobacteria bacterium]|nr:Rdx family protein [Pseudomonadota bacterium]MBU1389344.1 Rdx family protein [Pseudomonadota bacterium]MBU1544164.1 Rdx family protein [Pseudomonadota bacterium]MBU2480853.1 Rdx family protein [Pseudomonadota bacterium]
MADLLKDELHADCELIPGSKGIYDVIVDDKMIFSKHQANRFPENEEILSLIKS